jgi:hypothetical protein
MTWEESLAVSAAFMNDPAQEQYTDTVLLPYLNTALAELQETFELNNIPTTNKTSSVIFMPAGRDTVSYIPTPPVYANYLPDDLIEIQEVFESQVGLNNWIPVTKKNFLTVTSLGNTQISIFGVWAWIDQEIKVLPAIRDNDLKIDFVKSLFLPLILTDLADAITIKNITTFLQYRVAGLADEFIAENKSRADSLNNFGAMAIDRSLGISIKGQQSIVTRRRPFRASWKRRGILT